MQSTRSSAATKFVSEECLQLGNLLTICSFIFMSVFCYQIWYFETGLKTYPRTSHLQLLAEQFSAWPQAGDMDSWVKCVTTKSFMGKKNYLGQVIPQLGYQSA